MGELFENLNLYLYVTQHWITTFGFLTTLIGLILAFCKITNKLELFKRKSIADLNIANIATAKILIEQLLSVNNARNKSIFKKRMIELHELIIKLRETLPLKESDNIDKLNDTCLTLGQLVKQINKNVNITAKLIDFLTELKELLIVIECYNIKSN